MYDPSLLGSGGGGSSNGGKSGGNSGGSATAGDVNDAGQGNTGVAGTPPNGGTSGTDTGGSTAMGGDPGMAGATGDAGEAGDGPVAGSGGTGGGNGGTGGSGTAGGGAGGSSGAGGGGGTGGGVTATGCAKLSVPLDQTNDKAHFVISLTANANMGATGTPSTISVRYYVQAGAEGYIFPYVQDSNGFKFMSVPQVSWTDITPSTTWSTITWNVTTADAGSSGINKGSIKRIGIEINAGPTTVAWTNPTVIFIDSITVNTPALSVTLDDTATVDPTPVNADQANQVMWLNNGSSDTTATGAGLALSWQAKCP